MSIDPSPPTTVRDTATTGADVDQADTAARNKLVIGLLLVSAFVVILNETIMGVALPSLTRDLDITVTAGQWLTTGFMLTMAVVIPITGFLLQRFNTRPVFITAMSLFSLGTAISAIAPGFGVLLLGRVVQASGTAIMMPLLMTTVLTLVPPATRGRTMGNISIVISVAPAIGPTISGVILSVLEWRFMFILVLPIALAALALGAARVKNVTTPKKVPLDVTSVILSAFAFGGIVFGLSSIGEGAEAAVPAWVPLAVGVVALAAFVLRQRSLQRRDRALLDLRTFSSRTFTISASVLGVGMIALFGTLIVLPIYLQNVHGLDPLATGLLLLPGGLVQGLLSPVVGRLFDRYGPTVLLVPGTTLVSAVLWFMSTVSESTPIPMVLGAHVALSIGLAFMFTPLFTSGLGSLPSNLYSHGSAIVGTVQQLAGAAGTAVFVTVMTLAATAAASQSGAGAAATGAGVRAAFLVGAIISVFAVVGSFFVRRPPVVEGAEPVVAH
ncbi:DHA2 family efflux MFS transporter permease subunit [Frigoribacterium sp. PhB24]|uniref:DHA2 family efflux MFS transporter permease subunit n=1 Tax=Frigoribacterium sp. PhB24 TaxID=2485204 RepID=UPI000F47C86B|nr:DHA2 family efflux MFS transporter permease subunit [Frigoribacterium sp. PhB24]ROS52727.1 DHA2 family lincomycin resistance protein-like MFS transporter [Frigoribacterium sp. PhB24]